VTPTPGPAGPLGAAQLDQLARDGYLHIPGGIAAAWLDDVQAVLAPELDALRPASGDGLFAVQQLAERIPALRPSLWAGLPVELARQLLGPAVRLLSARYLVKPPQCPEVFPWHRDCEEYGDVDPDDGITLWIPTLAVDRTNGCLWYVPGSHRAAGADAPEAAPVCLPMQRGDLALHAMGTRHMSGRNRTDATRTVLVLEYIRADARDPATGRPFTHAHLIAP
jgi:hypothetical protein